MIRRTLTILEDAAHGWLSVSHADIRALGIQGQISRFSYVNGTRAYLEEDCDATVFLDEAKAQGWAVTLKSKVCKSDFGWIRDLPAYSADIIAYPLEDDRIVRLLHDGAVYWVLSKLGKRIWLKNENGYRLTVPASNPYDYIAPTPKMYNPAKDSHGYVKV